ncbi:hypothetical protein ScPMuIL_018699 [Solemya velum]
MGTYYGEDRVWMRRSFPFQKIPAVSSSPSVHRQSLLPQVFTGIDDGMSSHCHISGDWIKLETSVLSLLLTTSFVDMKRTFTKDGP